MFASPLIAAVILIEATAIGGARQRLVLLPGLLAAGIGTLVSIGMGSFTGLSSRDYALGPLPLPHFGHPDIAQFGWTIALAIAVAVVVRPIMLGGLSTHRVVVRRIVILLPIVGLIIAGLAIAFHGATGKSVNEVLFSGQEALPGLLRQAGTWSLGALALVIVFKGLAYMLSLGSFRGGPVFPALFLAAAGGIMASRLPGFSLTPAVAVGMGAAIAAVLRLPLAAIVLATLLTANSGTGDEPLIIVGVVVAYLITLRISAPAPAVSPAGDGAVAAQTPTPEVRRRHAERSPATAAEQNRRFARGSSTRARPDRQRLAATGSTGNVRFLASVPGGVAMRPARAAWVASGRCHRAWGRGVVGSGAASSGGERGGFGCVGDACPRRRRRGCRVRGPL